MADYNSPYTGAEIDAGIAKTDEIVQFVQVYSGAPSLEVDLSVLPVNPSTGDRTGVYDVVYSSDTISVDADTGGSRLGRVYVGNELTEARSTSTCNYFEENTKFNTTTAWYSGATGKFTCEGVSQTLATNTVYSNPNYIHKIYRLQKFS